MKGQTLDVYVYVSDYVYIHIDMIIEQEIYIQYPHRAPDTDWAYLSAAGKHVCFIPYAQYLATLAGSRVFRGRSKLVAIIHYCFD